jgi:hypothetical protein
MSESALLDLIVGGSPMAAFAGFLAWNFFQNRKQITEMNEKQFELFKELQNEKETQIEKLRDRYDVVINRLEDRDANLRSSIESRLDGVEKSLEGIGLKLTSITDRLQKLEIKDMVRNPNLE